MHFHGPTTVVNPHQQSLSEMTLYLLTYAFIEVVKMKNEKKKKKGFFSAIKESMLKTGGCCGPGETCGGPEKNNIKPAEKDIQKSEKG